MADKERGGWQVIFLMKFLQVTLINIHKIAIPVSGFANIHFYVPYVMAMGNSFSDPALRGVSLFHYNKFSC